MNSLKDSKPKSSIKTKLKNIDDLTEEEEMIEEEIKFNKKKNLKAKKDKSFERKVAIH